MCTPRPSFSVTWNSSLGLSSPLPWASSLLSLHSLSLSKTAPENPTIYLIYFAKQSRFLSLSQSLFLCSLPPFRPNSFPSRASIYFPKQNISPHTNFITTQADGSCSFCLFVINNNSPCPQNHFPPPNFQVLSVVHVLVF